MTKQDRQGVRTPMALEQKYRFGQTFAQAFGMAAAAQDAADAAQDAADAAREQVRELDESLTAQALFDRLTGYGAAQGIYRDEAGRIYINASYIRSGQLTADRIRSGMLMSENGATVFDLDSGQLVTARQCQIPDADGQPVPGYLALHLSSGQLRLAAHEAGGLSNDRLMIQSDASGQGPGCRIWDGGSEADFPRGLALTPVGELTVDSLAGDLRLGSCRSGGSRVTELAGDSLTLCSGDDAVNFQGCRLTALAQPQEPADAATKAYVDGRRDAQYAVAAGQALAFSLAQGELATFTYATDPTSWADVSLKLNGVSRSSGYVQAANTSFSTDAIVTVANNCPAFFTGTLRAMGGKVYLTGIGLRGNASGPGTIAMVWEELAQVESLTFSRAGTLAIRKL